MYDTNQLPKTFSLYHTTSSHLSSKPIKQILLEYQDLCGQGYDENDIHIVSDITGEIINSHTFYINNQPHTLSQIIDLLPYFDKFDNLTIPQICDLDVNYLEKV